MRGIKVVDVLVYYCAQINKRQEACMYARRLKPWRQGRWKIVRDRRWYVDLAGGCRRHRDILGVAGCVAWSGVALESRGQRLYRSVYFLPGHVRYRF